MTDAYLQSLGFAPAVPHTRPDRVAFNKSWRYQYDHTAADGTHLFLEHPLGIDACWLSAQELPLAPQDVTARLDLHDRPALEAAMTAFFAAHGGMGPLRAVSHNSFLPFRRRY